MSASSLLDQMSTDNQLSRLNNEIKGLPEDLSAVSTLIRFIATKNAPGEAQKRYLVGPTGLEPVTSSTSRKRSSQLS